MAETQLNGSEFFSCFFSSSATARRAYSAPAATRVYPTLAPQSARRLSVSFSPLVELLVVCCKEKGKGSQPTVLAHDTLMHDTRNGGEVSAGNPFVF